MESSQLSVDDGEGCNSSESGWTTYLASPMHDDDGKANGSEGSHVHDGNGYSNGRSGKDDDDNDDEDGDSLASDASTGPAQVKVPSMLNGKEGKDQQKNEDSDGKDEICSKLSTSFRKKAGKIEKGEGKASKRGHNKGRNSSRTSFFW